MRLVVNKISCQNIETTKAFYRLSTSQVLQSIVFKQWIPLLLDCKMDFVVVLCLWSSFATQYRNYIIISTCFFPILYSLSQEFMCLKISHLNRTFGYRKNKEIKDYKIYLFWCNTRYLDLPWFTVFRIIYSMIHRQS